jgi:hypothetical protein
MAEHDVRGPASGVCGAPDALRGACPVRKPGSGKRTDRKAGTAPRVDLTRVCCSLSPRPRRLLSFRWPKRVSLRRRSRVRLLLDSIPLWWSVRSRSMRSIVSAISGRFQPKELRKADFSRFEPCGPGGMGRRAEQGYGRCRVNGRVAVPCAYDSRSWLAVASARTAAWPASPMQPAGRVRFSFGARWRAAQ